MKLRTVLSSLFLASFALAVSGTASAHSGNVVEGVLTHVVGTANPNLNVTEVGGRFFRVHADDGHIVPVDLKGAMLPVGGVKELLNKRVRVTAPAGVAMQNMGFGQRLAATSVQAVAGGGGSALDDVFPTIGNRKYISLLCKWGSTTEEPRAPAFFQTQLGATSPGFNHYFQEMSYGAANITGSNAAAAWVTLPHPRSFYFPPGTPMDGEYLHDMAQACVTAAEASINFTGYVGVNLMFNAEVDDCCAWGGSDFLLLEGSNRLVSVTWMPYWGEPPFEFGWLDHGVLAHELSHSFGSPHSNGPGGYQYNNYWDVVSAPGGLCVTVDATYGCLGQHAVADNKMAMGFIAASRITTHALGAGSTTYSIERMAQPQNGAGTAQVLKVTAPGGHKYYTVESRQRVGYDSNIPGDGVLIHEVIDNRPFISQNNQGDPARLLRPDGATSPPLDRTPTGIGGLGARWSAGQAYVNATDDIRIAIDSYNASTGLATVTVGPAGAPGQYSFSVTSINVFEGAAASVNIAVTRSAPFTSAGSVAWATSNGPAIAGTDFGTAGSATQKSGTLTWSAGTGGVKNITVGLATAAIPIINDTLIEADKSFAITLASPVGGVLGANTVATVTIKDTDSVFAFESSALAVNEAGPNMTLQVVRSGSTALAQAVTYATSAVSATATSDYTTTTGTLTFAAGETAKTIAVGPVASAAPYIKVVNDALVEGPETFEVRLSAPTNGASLGAGNVAVVTINSDDSGVAMGAPTASFVEGTGAQTIAVNRSGSSGAMSVSYSFGGGTAVNGTHYNGVNGTLNWADGVTGTKTIPVTINNDALVNAARTFTVTLSNPVGGTLAAATTAVSITDNDNSVQFSAGTATVAEGATLTLTLTRTGLSTGGAADVSWSAVNGVGLAGTDFGTLGVLTPPSGTVHWDANDATSKPITIPVINDLIARSGRAFSVALSGPSGPNVVLGATTSVAVTITDNDKGLGFKSPTYEVTEGTTNVTLLISRTGSPSGTASATWTTGNGTAIAGADFGTLNNATQRSGTVTWASGDAADKSVLIPIINDTLGGEGDKTFTVTLTPGAGYIASTAVATVTIHDNDLLPQSNVQFSQAKYTVLENVGNAVVTVNRVNAGGGFGLAATVTYATQAGTALATSDYTTRTATLSWPAGNSDPKQILIPIVNSTAAESIESFKVVLTNPSNGVGLGENSQAAIVILDDDEAFPKLGAIPAGFSTPGGVTHGWHVANDPGAYEGMYTLKSDVIEGGESAGLQMAGTFAAGNVSFRVKASTEAGFDLLRFYVDGALQSPTWSGTTNTGWQLSPTYPVTAGFHTLKWVYAKDATADLGMDAVFLDGLVTPAFTPAP